MNLRIQVSWHLHILKTVILTRSWVTFHFNQILHLLSIDSLIAMIRKPENKGFLTLLILLKLKSFFINGSQRILFEVIYCTTICIHIGLENF